MIAGNLGALLLRQGAVPLDGKTSVLFAGAGLPVIEVKIFDIFELQLAVQTEVGRLQPSET